MTTPSPEEQPGAIVIVAALPRELSGLARQLGVRSIRKENGLHLQEGSMGGGRHPVLLVTAGMGPERAAVAVGAALARGPVAALVSVGLAGACAPGLLPGSVLTASTVIDTRSGERFTTDLRFDIAAEPRAASLAGPPVPRILVTSPQIAGVAEKRRLYQSYGAAAVDMEAATVARLGRAHGIPFGAIKAISDEHDVDVSHLSSFANSRGHFRTGAFAFHTLVRPNQWRSTIHLGRSSRAALEHLTREIHRSILDILAQQTPW